MRQFSLLLIGIILSSGAFAQSVRGTLHDGNGKPLSGATVSLLRPTDSLALKFTTTGTDGQYNLPAPAAGSFLLSASYIGYSTNYTAMFSIAEKEVTMPVIQLQKMDKALQGITVTAKKPIIEVKADKMIVNVEGTINATGSDALELLRKSPGVLVDKDDALSLAGKNGVQVFIDGRPTPLSGKDLSDYLKTLQAAQIEAIEIITNPSAKYEAAGNAGIINIRLKKNKSFGTNGSVNAGYAIGTYPKYNSGLALNHRNNKVNLFGNYNYNQSKNANYMNMYREAINDSVFDGRSDMLFRSKSHGFKAGMDYFASKKSTLGVIVSGNLADQRFTNYSRTAISYLPSKNPDRLLIADNANDMTRDNMNTNLNYRYTDTSGRELNLDADYGFYNINSDQLQPNFTYTSNGTTLLGSEIYNMLAPSEIDIYSVKGDYEQNFKKGRLGLGGKVSFVKTNNTFDRLSVVQSSKFMEHSNNFQYTENINAVYANYNRQYKGVMIQAGLRMENTSVEGQSSGRTWQGSNYKPFDSTLNRNYTNLFPSAAVTFNKNPMKQWNFTYSRRIDRPAYQDLNPFEFRLDKYSFQRGNTELRPQYTNSVAATFTYKYKLNTTVNYSHVTDVFSQLIDIDPLDSSKSFMTKKNLATQDITSLNVSYPFSYKSYSAFMNVNSYYSKFQANNGPGKKINIDVVAVSLYMQHSIKFAKTWTGEVSGWYSSPSIWQGTFKSKAMGGVDGGIQKVILKSKGTIKASVSDIFKTMQWSGVSNYAGQLMRVGGGWESRQFRVNFSYRFGNNQVKAARQRKSGLEDEEKRANAAGTGIGQ